MAESPNAELSIECVQGRRGGRATVIVRFPDESFLFNQVQLADESEREALADRICDRCESASREAVLQQLERGGIDLVTGADEETRAVQAQADQLVGLALDAAGVELFHCPDGEAYARFPVREHFETWLVRSKGFREWLAFRMFETQEKVPGSQALQDAINTLTGHAKFKGNEHRIHIRIAASAGEIWMDLCDAEWRAVRVTPHGWQIVSGTDVPVRFIRRRAMLALPDPVMGGSIDLLRPLVNLPHDDQWTLGVGWLEGAFRPTGPYGVLSVGGEAGSAKTTLCKLFRRTIDPNTADLRRPPKSERDVFIAARNSWICAYNNISEISDELSDAFCALATDGGFATRMLYTDDDEAIFSQRRPVMLNSIGDAVTRPDLVDRTIALILRRIEGDCLTEEEIEREYEPIRPLVLGALLTATSRALREKHGVVLPLKPRMADLATWVTAAEPSFGWDEGTFLEAYLTNRDDTQAAAIDSSPIGAPLMALMHSRQSWSGTAKKLLEELNRRRGKGSIPQGWPRTPPMMTNALRRIATALRSVGMRVFIPEKGVGREKVRVIELDWDGEKRSARSAQSADEPPAGHAARADRSEPPQSDGGARTGTPRANADHGCCRQHGLRHAWRPSGDLGWTCGKCHPPLEPTAAEWYRDQDAGRDL